MSNKVINKVTKKVTKDNGIPIVAGIHAEDFKSFCEHPKVKEKLVAITLNKVATERITEDDQIKFKEIDELVKSDSLSGVRAREMYAEIVMAKLSPEERDGIISSTTEENFLRVARFKGAGEWYVTEEVQSLIDTFFICKSLAEQNLMASAKLVFLVDDFAKFMKDRMAEFTRENFVEVERNASEAIILHNKKLDALKAEKSKAQGEA